MHYKMIQGSKALQGEGHWFNHIVTNHSSVHHSLPSCFSTSIYCDLVVTLSIWPMNLQNMCRKCGKSVTRFLCSHLFTRPTAKLNLFAFLHANWIDGGIISGFVNDIETSRAVIAGDPLDAQSQTCSESYTQYELKKQSIVCFSQKKLGANTSVHLSNVT
jgi:hypothetical protein